MNAPAFKLVLSSVKWFYSNTGNVDVAYYEATTDELFIATNRIVVKLNSLAGHLFIEMIIAVGLCKLEVKKILRSRIILSFYVKRIGLFQYQQFL